MLQLVYLLLRLPSHFFTFKYAKLGGTTSCVILPNSDAQLQCLGPILENSLFRTSELPM